MEQIRKFLQTTARTALICRKTAFCLNARKIALLGGSFNPAHSGHLHISVEALRRLGVDEVWWLVSPHNPLKDASELEDYSKRIEFAEQVANHPQIKVSDFEMHAGTQYTYDTLQQIIMRYPTHQFTWLMGADNLAGFHKWRDWKKIAELLPITVLDRRPMSHKALRSKGAVYLRHLSQCGVSEFNYQFIRPHPESSTHLRKTLGKNAFLYHNEIT